MRELATGRFIAGAENVLLFGPPGVGKTHLAIALGRAAVEAGHSVLFVTATSLLASLAKARGRGKSRRPDRLLREAEAPRRRRARLPAASRSAARNLFFQLVTRRYERGSMLITTNQMVTQWGHVFGDEMIAAAVLDRLLHHSHVLVIQGESYRLQQKKRAGLLARSTG